MTNPLLLSRLSFMVIAGLLFAGAILSPLHGQDVARMFDQANKLFNQGQPDQALPIAQKLATGDHGLTEISKARVWNLYGVCLLNTGKTDQAIEALKKGEAVYEKLRNSEREDYDLLVLNMSLAQKAAKRFDDAERSLNKLLELAEKKRSQWKPWFVHRQLSQLHGDTGKIDKALVSIHKALEEFEKSREKDQLSLSWIYGDITHYQNVKGDRVKAAATAEKWIEVSRRAYAADDPNLAAALKSHGHLLSKIERRREAHASLREAADIYLKNINGADPTTIERAAICLVALASEEVALNQLREAEVTFKQARGIIDRDPAKLMSTDAFWHAARASQYGVMNDHEKMVLHARQSHELYAKARGKDHPDTIGAQRVLAHALQRAGRGGEAGKITREIGDKAGGGGGTRSELNAYERRAWELFHKRDYDGAEKVFTEEYKKIIKDYGPDHPWVASALFGLLNTCYARKDDRKGAAIYANFSKFMQSHGSKADPDIQRDAYTGLALMAHRLGKTQEARVWAAKWYVDYVKLLNGVLGAGTQKQRLEFTQQWQPYVLFATMEDSRALATMALRLKGAVMDSLLEERRNALMSRDPKHRAAFAELTRLKEQYRKLTFSSDPAAAKEADRIQSQMDAKELELAGIGASSGTTRRALGVTVEQVQKKLPQDTVLIEFLRHMTSDHRYAYGAVIIPAKGRSKWVPIAPAEKLDGLLQGYKFISNHFGHPEMMQRSSAKLHEVLWQPIEKQLPAGTKRLVLSPDGDVCFISFATLLDPKSKFLCEKFDIQYVASGRDLLRQPYQREMEKAKDSMAIYADPSYLTGAAAKGGEQWMSQLPGARKEGEELKKMVEGWNWKVDLMSDTQAGEDAIRNKPAPRVLHLATHGFYFDHMPHPGKQDEEANPMLKSGLALAGAENTFRKWMAGQAPDPSSDGILMADELGDLNLRGTWLVCLSACQTGGGEAKSGEGVMGLRRGFVEAGAQHLISTLWPIPDDTTVPFMKDFYTRLEKTPDPPLVLSRVQRDWLVKMREEHKSAGVAIIKAGAFITSSYGQPGS